MQVPGYRDLTVLGRGGFSTVYRAVQESVLRDVALKVLAVHMAGADAKLRFRRECATNGRVGTHPNIVTLFDSGFADDGSPFLAMQLCTGGSLSERLRSQGPLPVADALRIGVKISAALAYAHSAGVLHRDIKPENILITEFGEPELADFGISSVDDQKMSTITASSFTINHAAPEALEGQPSSVATDIYGLCSTLYTLVAGRTPFVAPSATGIYALVNKVMTEIPPPTGRADVPGSLERLLASGLAKAPADRPVDGQSLGSALQDIQRELGLPVTEFPSAPPPLAYSPTQTLSDMDGSRRGAGRAGAAGGAVGGAAFGDATPDTGDLPPTGAMPPLTGTPTSNPAAGAAAGAAGVAAGGVAAGAAASGQWGAWAGDQRPTPAADPYGRREPPLYPPVLGPPQVLAADPRPGAGPPDRKDRRAALIAGAIVLLLLLATGVYLVARTGKDQPVASGTGVSSPSSVASSFAARSSSPSPTSTPSSSRSSTPPTTTKSSTTSSSTTASSTTAAAAAPTIDSFGSSSVPDGGTVNCESTNSSVDIPFVWSSTNAAKAWIGEDIGGDDASKEPLDANGVPTSSSRTLPFTCSAGKHTFTLTVKNKAGTPVVSKSVTFLRALPETSTSQNSSSSTTPSTSTSATTPSTSSSASTSSTPTTSPSETSTSSSLATTPATS